MLETDKIITQLYLRKNASSLDKVAEGFHQASKTNSLSVI